MAIHFDTQGPAPDGFHVPSRYEWDDLVGILYSSFGFPKNGATMKTYLKLPLAGRRSSSSSDVSNQGSYGYYWTPSYTGNYSYYFWVGDSSVEFTNYTERGSGYSLRCFKDRPVTPDNNRTQLYDGGDGPQGELTGVYHNATLGLISISSNGTSWTTIQDKNLGATTVYNDGDTLSEANCGKYYQRGNNYGFPFTGTISKTSSTQVDASTYGPGNYYEDDTFIRLTRRDSSGNQNLWGGKTNGTRGYPDMRLHGAIQTFHWKAPEVDTYLNENTIAYYPLTEDLLDHKDNGNTLYPLTANGSGYSFSANADGYKAIYFTGGTYLYPGSGNIWGKHPGTDDMTIAFRISGFTSPAYGTYGYSGYHSGILSFDRTFKTGVGSDGVVGRGVGMLDLGYEGFSGETGYSTDDSGNPITVTTPLVSGLSMGQTYGNSFISVVDTFHNGHHTRYISSEGFGVEHPYYESNYGGSKSVSQNYIGRDSYSTSNYRYLHGYMRDFVVAGDVWTPMMIRNYFNEDLGGYSPTNNTIAYYPFTTDVNDALGNYNGTVAGTDVTYGTVGGSVIKAAYLTSTRITTSLTTQPKTISFWLYKPSSSSDPSINNRKQFLGFNSSDNGDGIRFRGVELNSSSGCFGMQVGNTLSTSSQGKKTDQRYNIIITTDNTNRYTYINGQLAITASGNFGTAETGLWLGTSPYDGISSNYNSYAYYSMLILENKTWTANEALAYYNNIKSNYGL